MSINVSVELYGPSIRDRYEEFLDRCEYHLLYHSLKFQDFLQRVLDNSISLIIVASEGGRWVGSLTAWIQTNNLTTVLNSLPYFGSHGDILVSNDVIHRAHIIRAILETLRELTVERSVGAINVVAHPIASHISPFGAKANLSPWDMRIGQISILSLAKNDADALNATLADCKQKTRNLVRKGIKGNFKIEVSTSDSDWHSLFLHHCVGMQRIDAKHKSEREIHALREQFEACGACRLYVARRDGEFAAGLLNLYYKDWVEYFIPVSSERFRGDQVLSAIIARAVQDARRQGCKYWNWGGTWPGQKGVYRFKNGWGAHDYRYHYYGAVRDERLNKVDPGTLLADFPHFYVRPFRTVST